MSREWVGISRFVPVVTSLVAFISEVTNKTDWWVYSLDRASYVLVVFAVVAALLSERQANLVVLGAEFLAGVTALVFMAIALVKFYDAIPAFGVNFTTAHPWLSEAQVLALAALAFGLTLTRRRSSAAMGALSAAIVIAFGCAIYAITKKDTYTGETWWLVAIAGAFLAAAAAAGLERDGGTVALDTPVAGGWDNEPESDPGIEEPSDPVVESESDPENDPGAE